MPTPETPQGDTKADEFAEFEKDIEGYLGRLERWADLSRYDRYLGRLRSVLGHAYFLFGGEREGSALLDSAWGGLRRLRPELRYGC